MPAKAKIFKWLVSISPVVTLASIKSLKLVGQPAQPKASLRQHHANLEIEHPKKMWLVDSTLLHKQQWTFPFQPLFLSEAATCSLLCFNCHMKILIFSGSLDFQTSSDAGMHTSLCVKNLYSDLVVKDFEPSKAQVTSSHESWTSTTFCKRLRSSFQFTFSLGVKLRRKLTHQSPLAKQSETRTVGSSQSLNSLGNRVFKGSWPSQVSPKRKWATRHPLYAWLPI